MEILGYLASFAMGITLGLMGGGGSILTVPILVYFFALPPTLATGYSLFIVGLTALIGSFMYIRKGDIDFQAGLAFAIPSVVGVNISRGLILPSLPASLFQLGQLTLTKEILVMITFASLMVIASFSMIRSRKEPGLSNLSSATRFVMMILQGFIVGLIAGFVGAGGGFLIIPALVLMAGLTMRIAIGTSLLVIAFQSLLGFFGDMARGLSIDWRFLFLMSGLAALGIIFGSTIAHKIQERKLKVAFGWFVLVMGLTILIEQLRHLSQGVAL